MLSLCGIHTKVLEFLEKSLPRSDAAQTGCCNKKLSAVACVNYPF